MVGIETSTLVRTLELLKETILSWSSMRYLTKWLLSTRTKWVLSFWTMR